MKILALTTLFPSPWMPHRAAFNRQQFAALAAEHQVHVIAPVSWIDRLRSRCERPTSRLRMADGMTIEHPAYLYTPGFLRGRHGKFYVRCVRRTFDRAVEAVNPDVVLAAWAYPDAWAAAELCRAANLPLVAKVHGSDVLLAGSGSQRERLTADALGAADAVVTVSRQLAGAVARLGVSTDRIHTVYNGIDPGIFFDNGWRSHSSVARLLFVGNFVNVKGVDTLIDACARLRAQRISFHCDLIGQGPMERTLAMRIKALQLQGHVRLHPPRAHRTLAEAYRNADVLILPSRSEGVPNVVLEALACGTPVVATRVGGIPEILDPENLIAPNDPQALTDAIVAALREPSALREPRVSTFRPRSWRDSARQLADVMHSVSVPRRKAAA